MRAVLKTIVAVGAALILGMSPSMAANLGIYQDELKQLDFQLTTCGDGTELCVTLLDARGSSRKDHVVPYIGKYIVANAKADGPNRWKGNIHIDKYDAGGTMVLVPGKSFTVTGCVFFVFCDDLNLYPAN